MEIIGLIIAGIIIGALGRLFLPGQQDVPWWLHIIVGVVAVQIGYWIAAALGVERAGAGCTGPGGGAKVRAATGCVGSSASSSRCAGCISSLGCAPAGPPPEAFPAAFVGPQGNDHVHHPCPYITRPASLVMYGFAW